MAQTNADFPHRRILPVKAPSRLLAKGFARTAKSARVRKSTPVALPELTLLSEDQLWKAKILAEILPAHIVRPQEEEFPKFWADRTPTPSPEPRSPTFTPSSSPPPLPTSSIHTTPDSTLDVEQTPETEPTPEVEEEENWETMATRIIAQKKYTLNDTWSGYTWKNKTSIGVRLKLLKNDGYDITPLQGKGITSGKVTEAVLAHIASRKAGVIPAAVSPAKVEDPAEDDPFLNDMMQQFMDDEDDVPQVQQPIKQEQAIAAPAASAPELAAENSRVCYHVEPFRFPAKFIIGQKRKHPHEEGEEYENKGQPQLLPHDTPVPEEDEDTLIPDEDEDTPFFEENEGTPVLEEEEDTPIFEEGQATVLEEHQDTPVLEEPLYTPIFGERLLLECNCGPLSKKLRTLDPAETEKHIAENALRLFEKNAVRAIFSGNHFFVDHSGIVQPAPLSMISFASPELSSRSQRDPEFQLGTRAMSYIMDELKHLWNVKIHKTTLFLCDPEVVENGIADDMLIRSICITEDVQHGIEIRGNAHALAGLMHTIRTHDLNHTSSWVFDGMEVVPEGNTAWSLSPETNNVLAGIESALLAGAAHGEVHVRVEQFCNGGKRCYDCH